MTRPSAECPRCGYNLDGTVSTWTTQCPIRGRCNECGLELDWHRVFVLTVHPWLFEYHWRRRPFSRFLQTVSYAFRPRRFWREVRLTDPVHLMPAAVVTGSLALTGIVLLIATMVLPDYQWRLKGFFVGRSFPQYGILEATLRMPRTIIRLMPGLPVALFAMPVIFALIPTTMRQARVRHRHIVRIFFLLAHSADHDRVCVVRREVDIAHHRVEWTRRRDRSVLLATARWFFGSDDLLITASARHGPCTALHGVDGELVVPGVSAIPPT